MNNKMMDIGIAIQKINEVKKILDDLQQAGWTTEICNENHSVFLSNGTIFVKAYPTNRIVISAD